MRTIQTKYRVFRLINEPAADPAHYRLENCTHIEFEVAADAESWLKENGDHRIATHDYVVLPCVKIVDEND
jgi:hypothetical protein